MLIGPGRDRRRFIAEEVVAGALGVGRFADGGRPTATAWAPARPTSPSQGGSHAGRDAPGKWFLERAGGVRLPSGRQPAPVLEAVAPGIALELPQEGQRTRGGVRSSRFNPLEGPTPSASKLLLVGG